MRTKAALVDQKYSKTILFVHFLLLSMLKKVVSDA